MEWENLEIELAGAIFRAGDAYGTLAGRQAYSAFLKLTYEF